MPAFAVLKGQIQPYQWGGHDFLPHLLGYSNDSKIPQAEYWLGAHPSAPAVIDTPLGPVGIEEYCEKNQLSLQFLFKILDVRNMLSVQVHPTRQQAQIGFARENAAGIAITANNRNYKDANHKPELMVALSEFWLLHGFRTERDILGHLSAKPYLAPLSGCLIEHGLSAAFAMALAHQDAITARLHQDLLNDFNQRPQLTDKTQPDFWVQRWLNQNPGVTNGLLTLYFLNLVKVNVGEAVYQPAGLLHAYLEGQNVELMANSDNVLRAGLTPKHMDVAELLNICLLQPSQPSNYIARPLLGESGETRFLTPFEEFELAELRAAQQREFLWQTNAPEILFCSQGSATLSADDGHIRQLNRGDSILLLPNHKISLTFSSGSGQAFKARNL